MFNIELLIIPLFLLISVYLVCKNIKYALYALLGLSLLVHKEMFSVYRWDILPIRLLIAAFAFTLLSKVFYKLFMEYREGNLYKYAVLNLKSLLADPYTVLFILIWVSALVSLPFTKNISVSLVRFGFLSVVCIFSLYFYKTFSKNPQEVKNYIMFYIFCAFILSLFGYLQLFLNYKYGIVIGAFWTIPGKIARIGSLFWDVNHFGGFLASLLPVVAVMTLVADKLKYKVIAVVVMLPVVGMLLLTNSRTSWIIAAFAFIFFIVVLLFRWFGIRGVLAMLFCFILLSVPFVLEYQDKTSPFRKRIKDYFHYRIDSFDSHLLLINGALEVYETYPVFGGGYGSFFEHFSKTSVAPTLFGRDPAALNTRVPAHSIWGESLSETGTFGFVVLLSFVLFQLLTHLYAALKLQKFKDYMLAASMGAAVFGWYVAGVFYSYNSEFFWFILVLYLTYTVGILNVNFKEFSFSQMIKFFTAQSTSKFDLLLLLVLAGGLILTGLSTNHLIPWDEAIYAQISKTMYLTGDFINMHWIRDTTVHWFEKPPLYMWISALLMNIVGVSHLAVKLPSAVFGISTILLTYVFGKKLFSRTIGILAALTLLTNISFLYYSRIGMFDVSLTFFITLTLYFYWHTLNSANKTMLYWLATGLSLGLAVMIKGVAGLVTLLPIMVLELINYKHLFTINKLKSYITFFGGFFVTGLSWHLYMLYLFGNSFYDSYILYHVIDRATNGIEDKGRPLLWYLVVMRVSMRLWFVALLGAFPFTLFVAFYRYWIQLFTKFFLVQKLNAYFKSLNITPQVSSNHLFLLVWSTTIFIFFSSSISKITWYIMPIYPVLGIIVGYFISKTLDLALLNIRIFKQNYLVLKVISLWVLFIGSFVYLYLVRSMTYVPDLTKAQAQLLMLKDARFGVDTNVYVDQIELPLILFYTNGPFRVVDFSILKDSLKSANYTDSYVFITKESRVRKLVELGYTPIDLEEQINEWALARFPSKKELDEITLKQKQTELEKLLSDLDKKERNNVSVSASDYFRVDTLNNEILALQDRISNTNF
ncbi:MAG: glycosyltransferase family 39 protein [Patescibacteria group bacterium]|uniref:Glycosyltransferase family 39 protein n=1 Tax=candidate division WWE3 bacterium TaxID=2053526 RepID=A0A955EBV8_UNCKA|nr:glycosyltransferase family 39 protein [candidate division WWE3 bacterium]